MGIDNPPKNNITRYLSMPAGRGTFTLTRMPLFTCSKNIITTWGRPLKACHPRDLLDQLADFATYRGEPPAMTIDLVDRAARSYFAELFLRRSSHFPLIFRATDPPRRFNSLPAFLITMTRMNE